MGKTSESRMRIVIEAKNTATGEIRKVTQELRQIEKVTGDANNKQQTFMQTLGGLKTSALAAGAAIAGAAMTIKKAWDFAEEGAGISRLEGATTSLADSMGGNMDRIVSAVRAASNGTVSDYGIMQASGRAMMLGLGADSEKLANLMQVAMFRGRAFGLSAEQAFSDIVTGVGRMSPLILDNLGIVLDAEKTYADYAASVGKGADALSSMEKRQALLNRVLEEGNRMMKEAGGLVDDAASPYERLSTTMQNKTAQMKKDAGGFFAPVANALNRSFTRIDSVRDRLNAAERQIYATSGSYSEYISRLKEAAAAEGMAIDSQNQLVELYGGASGEVVNTLAKNFAASSELFKAIKQASNVPDDPLRNSMRRTQADLSAQSRPYAVDPKALVIMGKMSFAQAAVGFSAAETNRKMSELQLFMDGPVRKADEDYINRSKQLKQQLSETAKKLEELRKTPWKKEELQQTEEAYAGIKTQITENEQAHSLASKKIIFDLAAQRMAADGLTQEEADAQVELAKKFGLIDEATAAMWEGIKKPVDQMSAGKLTAEGWLQAMQNLATTWEIRVRWQQEGEPPWPPSSSPKPKDAKNGGGKVEQQYATGGSFIVPGTGGIDSQHVAFRATPGEKVTISPPGKNAGGGVTLKNYGNIYVGSLEEFGNYGN